MIEGALGKGDSLELHLQNILALQEVYLGKEAHRFSSLSVKHLTDIKGVVVAHRSINCADRRFYLQAVF